jgi:hypothetical protein
MIGMKQRSLEEVKALKGEEVVEIMRQAGIIGAVSQEEAEAEAEATRPVEPQEEAKAEASR